MRAARVGLLRREPALLAGRAGDRPDRAHLGHAPAVRDVEAVRARETPRSSPRGGAAPPTVIERIAERSQPSGFASSACRIPIQIVGTPAVTVTSCSAKASSRLVGIEVRAGEDLLDAGQRAGEREAPGVRVEHRHDGQARRRPRTCRGSRSTRRARGARSRGASRGRPSAARRAARVAHRRGRVLVEVAVRRTPTRRRREELLVVDRAVRRRAVADHDHVLEAAARSTNCSTSGQSILSTMITGRRRASRCR